MNKIIAYNTSAYGDGNFKRAKLTGETFKNLKLNIDSQGHVIFSEMSADLKFSILTFVPFFFYKSKADNFVKGLKNILSAYDEASIEAAVKPIVEDIMMAAPTFERFDEFLKIFIDEDIFKTSEFLDSARFGAISAFAPPGLAISFSRGPPSCLLRPGITAQLERRLPPKSLNC